MKFISLLEIRYQKNLAKLKGSAVRINGNKPKGKNTMKEKNSSGRGSFYTCLVPGDCLILHTNSVSSHCLPSY